MGRHILAWFLIVLFAPWVGRIGFFIGFMFGSPIAAYVAGGLGVLGTIMAVYQKIDEADKARGS